MPLREDSIERVFAYHRWTEMLDRQPTPGGLAPIPAVRVGKFHTAHKLTLMARPGDGIPRDITGTGRTGSPKHYTEMARLVAADVGKQDGDELAAEYGAQLEAQVGRQKTNRQYGENLGLSVWSSCLLKSTPPGD